MKIGRSWTMPLLFAGAALLFLLWPGIDLAVAGVFYRPGEGFFLIQSAWVQWFYVWSPRLVQWSAIALALLALASLWRPWRYLARPTLFLLTVILVGPWATVSYLKDNFGRARPIQIVQFGGEMKFTPAFVPSDQCERNCSFVSGHASGAFAVLAMAWAFPRRRKTWLWIGSLWGVHMGLIRMAQGGHFLSDVIFAGFIVYFSADLLARFVFYRSRPA